MDSNIIVEGDMLHTDMGIFTMGLATDTQHLACTSLFLLYPTISNLILLTNFLSLIRRETRCTEKK